VTSRDATLGRRASDLARNNPGMVGRQGTPESRFRLVW